MNTLVNIFVSQLNETISSTIKCEYIYLFMNTLMNVLVIQIFEPIIYIINSEYIDLFMNALMNVLMNIFIVIMEPHNKLWID